MAVWIVWTKAKEQLKQIRCSSLNLIRCLGSISKLFFSMSWKTVYTITKKLFDGSSSSLANVFMILMPNWWTSNPLIIIEINMFLAGSKFKNFSEKIDFFALSSSNQPIIFFSTILGSLIAYIYCIYWLNFLRRLFQIILRGAGVYIAFGLPSGQLHDDWLYLRNFNFL